MSKSVKKLPGVLSFQRSVEISDGIFFNVHKSDGGLTIGKEIPVIRHGIRGTQNVNEKPGKGGTAKSGSQREITNVQTTETAKTEHDARGFAVRFTFRPIDISNALFSCAGGDGETAEIVKAMVNEFIEKTKKSSTLIEIGNRYARTIANAGWLWRNRKIAQSITTTARVFKRGDDNAIAEYDFSSLDTSINEFGYYSTEEKALGSFVASGFRGDQISIEVTAVVDFGATGAFEVFPSQNYLENKPKGFARSLYKIAKNNAPKRVFDDINIVGIAALREQKIGNALRTFDTWYSEYASLGLAIAIEPNGANLGEQKAFRLGEKSSFALFRKLGEIDVESDEGLFALAALIRGGVYSESDKTDKKSDKDADVEADAQ